MAENNDEIKRLNKKLDELAQQNYRQSFLKSEGTTLVLSLILGLFGVLGVGYMYIGKIVKGVLFLIVGLLFFIIGIATITTHPYIGIIFLFCYFWFFLWQIVVSKSLCKQNNQYFLKTGRKLW